MKTICLVAIVVLLLVVHSPASAADFVRGDAQFKAQVTAALDLILHADPGDYAASITYVSYIEQNHRPDNWSFIYGYDSLCKIELTLDVSIPDETWQVADDLVHEGSMCHEYRLGNVVDVRADEIRALVLQRQFLITAHGPKYLIDYISALIARKADYYR